MKCTICELSAAAKINEFNIKDIFRSSYKEVHVRLADLNDHPPVFDKEEYEVRISESALPNTPLTRLKVKPPFLFGLFFRDCYTFYLFYLSIYIPFYISTFLPFYLQSTLSTLIFPSTPSTLFVLSTPSKLSTLSSPLPPSP